MIRRLGGLLRGVPLPPWTLLVGFGFLLAGVFAFAFLANEISDGPLAFDEATLNWIYLHQEAVITRAALTLDAFAIPFVLGPMLLVFATALLEGGHPRSALFVTLSYWGAVAVNLVSKAFFERARPDLFEHLTPATNTSFPSGHAMGAAAAALAVYLVCRRLAPRFQFTAGLATLLFGASVGISRVYLQVHYPSDVLAGWGLSIAWVLLLNLWYRWNIGSGREDAGQVAPD